MVEVIRGGECLFSALLGGHGVEAREGAARLNNVLEGRCIGVCDN